MVFPYTSIFGFARIPILHCLLIIRTCTRVQADYAREYRRTMHDANTGGLCTRIQAYQIITHVLFRRGTDLESIACTNSRVFFDRYSSERTLLLEKKRNALRSAVHALSIVVLFDKEQRRTIVKTSNKTAESERNIIYEPLLFMCSMTMRQNDVKLKRKLVNTFLKTILVNFAIHNNSIFYYIIRKVSLYKMFCPTNYAKYCNL